MLHSLILSLVLVIAAAPTTQPAAKLSEGHYKDLWQRHWPLFAARYVKVGDAYLPCAKYNYDYPSSRLEVPEKHTDAHQKKQTVRSNDDIGAGMVRTMTTKLPRDDAEAYVRAIPALAPGEYGYIRGGTVVEVIGPGEMLLSDILLLDPNEVLKEKQEEANEIARREAARNDRRALEAQVNWRFQKRNELLKLQDDNDFQKTLKLVGFDTTDAKAGQVWTGETKIQQQEGIRIAIVSEQPNPAKQTRRAVRTSRRRPGDTVMVAVPVERFRVRELSEDQFLEMLASRGYDKTRFINLVLEQKRKDPANADVTIIGMLEEERIKQEEEARKQADDPRKNARSRPQVLPSRTQQQ